MSSKIKRITVNNLQAISTQTADFNGCTAIVTAGNDKGKTTFLRRIFERIRGSQPDVVLKHGEKEGYAEAELTSGEKFKWEFKTDAEGSKKEKLIFITEKDIKKSLTRAISEQYFPAVFDVDTFLQAQPAIQRKTLQKIVGIDFTDIDARHKTAYEDREAKNRRSRENKIKFEGAKMPEKAIAVDVTKLLQEKQTIRTELNNLYLANKKHNDDLRNDYEAAKFDVSVEFDKLKAQQHDANQKVLRCIEIWEKLEREGYKGEEVKEWISQLQRFETPVKKEVIEPIYITELPNDSSLLAIDEKINAANETNRKAALYKDWINLRQSMIDSASEAGESDAKVKAIEEERMTIIRGANMPEGFSFSNEGILYNELPFDRDQLSSSSIYIAALKLASMNLGEVRCLHFDASFLDRESLNKIEEWATKNDMQLLIERPNFEGGEIEYQLISEPLN